ncbi:MAG: hypothetical protein ABFS45_07570 [Pseudomonadota bacterium]
MLKPIRMKRDIREQYTSMTQDHDQQTRDPVKQAFKEWKKAASEWAVLYRRLEQQSHPLPLEEQMRLRFLEKGLNRAAEKYEQALNKSN